MDKSKEKRLARGRRHERVRKNLQGTPERPRLCVFRSLKHMYAQVIDDTQSHTLVSASTLDAEVQAEANGKDKAGQAEAVGTVLARRAQAAGIKSVVFDRGGYLYHGRVKSLADAARKAGLEF
jgi:large subunit ribosomal protein L18